MTDERYANEPPAQHPRIRGRCPACGAESLFLGSNGYVTCSVIGCKEPGAATDLLAAPPPPEAAGTAMKLDNLTEPCPMCDGWGRVISPAPPLPADAARLALVRKWRMKAEAHTKAANQRPARSKERSLRHARADVYYECASNLEDALRASATAAPEPGGEGGEQ